jgi:uncharacterized protein
MAAFFTRRSEYVMSLWFVIPLVAIAALVFYGVFIESHWFRYKELPIHTRKPLPSGDLTILHLSDIHFKRWSPNLARIFRDLGKRTFDLILLTGDMVDSYHGNKNALKGLGHLRARYGIFCVFGNHEYLKYTPLNFFRFLIGAVFRPKKNPGLREFENGLAALGIIHIRNRSEALRKLGITLVGVDDFHAGRSHMRKAIRNLSTHTFNLLMTHHPDSVLSANPEWCDFALCGHTHGGQIRLPFWGALVTDSHLNRKTAGGRVRINGIDSYVSHGLGTSGIATARFLCRPEILEFRLTSEVSKNGVA